MDGAGSPIATMTNKKPPKVLHLLHTISLVGGTPRKILDLAAHSELHHHIFCYSRPLTSAEFSQVRQVFESKGVPVHVPSATGFFSVVKSLLQLIKAEKVDIVQGYFNRGYIYCALAVLARPRVRAVAAFVGLAQELPAMERFAVAGALSRMRDYIFVTGSVRRSQESMYPRLAGRGRVIHNGAVARMHESSVARPNETGCYFVSVSGLNSHKNINILVKAAAILRGRNLPFVMDIVGDGPLRAELAESIQQKGLADCVRLLGYQADVGSYLAAADVYLHPAHREGFGISVVEAMLAELPCILANAGGLTELARHDASALFVEPHDPAKWADTMERLADDQELRTRIGRAGKAHAERSFSAAKFGALHDEFYRDVLS